MADNNRIGDITKTSLDSIRAMLDPNTVVGNPIETAAGTTIIPISKVSVGYASGGVSVTPGAFLVVNKEGEVSVLNGATSASSTAPADAVSQVVGFLERSPDLLERIKGVFSKKGEENKI